MHQASSSSLPSTCPHKAPRAVKFLTETHVIPIKSPWNTCELYTPKMEQKLFETFPGSLVTDVMFDEATKVFNENYGKPVKLSARRLREQCLPDPAATSCVRVTVMGTLLEMPSRAAGNTAEKTFAGSLQSVVDRKFRELGLASSLLWSIGSDSDDMYGIMSSHPAACMAALTGVATPAVPHRRQIILYERHK
ncbi:hypothetical protein ACJ73_03972 [Blastomyces percursus]|uniref:Uncharacterized protein n=1 Tax=Blastomyces percursus TaxID=1658174 RepID=A0A1J9R9K9_9EURO|nr:hypothetical protein ACJ73_03972 [Blastomyces percursus]